MMEKYTEDEIAAATTFAGSPFREKVLRKLKENRKLPADNETFTLGQLRQSYNRVMNSTFMVATDLLELLIKDMTEHQPKEAELVVGAVYKHENVDYLYKWNTGGYFTTFGSVLMTLRENVDLTKMTMVYDPRQ